jgi:vancomycin resistance protein YoaR
MLGVEVDWASAVKAAERQGGGYGIVRGYRRLELEFFPADLAPSINAYDAALDYELDQIGRAVNTPPHEARLVRRGLHISIAGGTTGRVLDRGEARETIVRALAAFSRRPVALPVRTHSPRVKVATN